MVNEVKPKIHWENFVIYVSGMFMKVNGWMNEYMVYIDNKLYELWVKLIFSIKWRINIIFK